MYNKWTRPFTNLNENYTEIVKYHVKQDDG